MINTKMLKYIGVNFSLLTQGRGLSPYFSKLDTKNHKIIISLDTISTGKFNTTDNGRRQ